MTCFNVRLIEETFFYDHFFYKNTRKIPTGSGIDYTTGLLNNSYFEEKYKLIAVDLRKKTSSCC